MSLSKLVLNLVLMSDSAFLQLSTVPSTVIVLSILYGVRSLILKYNKIIYDFYSSIAMCCSLGDSYLRITFCHYSF